MPPPPSPPEPPGQPEPPLLEPPPLLPLRLTAPIRTERLVLRLYAPDDLDAHFDIQSRAEVARYLYWSPRDREQAAETLQQKINHRSIEADGDILSLAVVRAEGGPLIGDLMVRYASATHRQVEIGYIFHPDAHGQGFATEATRAIVDLAFRQLRAHRVYGQIDARNDASARVLERVGMRREAHLVQNEWVKGEWTDEAIYAVLAAEWAALSNGEH
jgi:RimJ/RimL family protein N-acetyltransferase